MFISYSNNSNNNKSSLLFFLADEENSDELNVEITENEACLLQNQVK